MKNVIIAATMVLTLAAVAHAQATLTGKWQGTTKTGSRWRWT